MGQYSNSSFHKHLLCRRSADVSYVSIGLGIMLHHLHWSAFKDMQMVILFSELLFCSKDFKTADDFSNSHNSCHFTIADKLKTSVTEQLYYICQSCNVAIIDFTEMLFKKSKLLSSGTDQKLSNNMLTQTCMVCLHV